MQEISRGLQELELVNIQGHVLSYFEFHKHLNIITGTSNHGKSSIVRAILWATENEPYGVDYLNWDADEKEGAETHMVFDTGTVSRIKRKGFNGYVLSTLSVDEDTFEALRNDVPIEVKAIHGLDRHNIRGQDDGYFMLQDSPGNVARMLNKKTGLDDIDKVNSISKTLIKEYSDRLKFTKEELKKNVEREQYLLKIKSFEDRIKELDELYKEFDRTEKKQNQLELTLSTLFDLDIKIEDCNQVLKRQEDLDILSKMLERRLTVASRHTKLRLYLNEIDRLETTIEHVLIEMEKGPLLNDLNLLLVERKELMAKWSTLQAYRTYFLNIDKAIGSLEKGIKERDKKLKELKAQREAIDICPTCGADKEYWKHDIMEV